MSPNLVSMGPAAAYHLDSIRGPSPAIPESRSNFGNGRVWWEAARLLLGCSQRKRTFVQMAGQGADLMTTSKETVDNWFDAFKEQRQFEAPIRLWDGRALSYETTLKTRQKWVIGVGLLGLLVAAGVALCMFEIARHLLHDAVIEPVKDS